MRVVIETGGDRAWEAEVRVHRRDATVGDLVSALDPGLPSNTPLVACGRLVTGDVRLAESG